METEVSIRLFGAARGNLSVALRVLAIWCDLVPSSSSVALARPAPGASADRSARWSWIISPLQARAGSRPGVPSHFLLLAQKKVTKEKSLKHI